MVPLGMVLIALGLLAIGYSGLAFPIDPRLGWFSLTLAAPALASGLALVLAARRRANRRRMAGWRQCPVCARTGRAPEDRWVDHPGAAPARSHFCAACSGRGVLPPLASGAK